MSWNRHVWQWLHSGLSKFQSLGYPFLCFCHSYKPTILLTCYFPINKIAFSWKIHFFKKRFLGPRASNAHVDQLRAQVLDDLLHSSGHRHTPWWPNTSFGKQLHLLLRRTWQDSWPWAPRKVWFWAHAGRQQAFPSVPQEFPALGAEKQWLLGLPESWGGYRNILTGHESQGWASAKAFPLTSFLLKILATIQKKKKWNFYHCHRKPVSLVIN